MSLPIQEATARHPSASQERSAQKTPFAFILAHSFSGSTLLSFLLGAHPEIATVGEMFIAPTHNSADYPCSCGEPIERCAFWRRVSAQMAARGVPFDVRGADSSLSAGSYGPLGSRIVWAEPRGPFLEGIRQAALRRMPGVRRELDRRIAVNRLLAEVVLDLRNARVFVDATKRPGRALLLRRDPRLDFQVIHLVRDGRAVSRSAVHNLGRTVEEGARSWAASARRSEELRRYVPAERWLTVRHEDLCRDSRGTLERIFEFLDVSPDVSIGDFREVRAGDHHIIGNRMRLSRASEIRLDERWRTELSLDQKRTVERIAGSELARYGYALD
ncbi:MAG TPA: sulfotransferase [Thermoanaerobaculia bacterium]|nr:sulfotransferase [Thermoanaerobaculia bacterium]